MNNPIGSHCPTDLLDRYDYESYVKVLAIHPSDDGYPTGERINGFYQCPKCNAWWPCIEQPDMWTWDDSGKWRISGWWGAAVCATCGLLMLDQPNGQGECYQL
jgi:hypothetical protein